MYGTAVALGWELLRVLVNELAYAVERAKRPMLYHAIRGAEAKPVLNIRGALVRHRKVNGTWGLIGDEEA